MDRAFKFLRILNRELRCGVEELFSAMEFYAIFTYRI